MKWEYLLFNLVILLCPVALSFDRRVHYVSRWSLALLSCGMCLIPYVLWDALVVGRHWWFSEATILGWRVAGLPVEEWLFFISVPFACLFIWDVLHAYLDNRRIPGLKYLRISLVFTFPLGLTMFHYRKGYTALVLISISLVVYLDAWLKTDLLLRSTTYLYLAIVVGLILIFNTYLTARPVVLYGESYQLGFRIGTIPVEDFAYGLGLVLLNTELYEKLKERRGG